MRKRKNAGSVWIMVRRIGQSGGSDYEGEFLNVSVGCEIFLWSFAVAAAAVFEGAACNFSSWGGSCCCYSHHHHHAGSVHVGSSPALGP